MTDPALARLRYALIWKPPTHLGWTALHRKDDDPPLHVTHRETFMVFGCNRQAIYMGLSDYMKKFTRQAQVYDLVGYRRGSDPDRPTWAEFDIDFGHFIPVDTREPVIR
jgi:hypothetical protein